MTLNQLKRRAKAHGLMIRKERNGGYWLVDIYINGAVVPGPMSLEVVEQWLDEFDEREAQQEGE